MYVCWCIYLYVPVPRLEDVRQHSSTLMLAAEQSDSARRQDAQTWTEDWWHTAAVEMQPSHCTIISRSHFSHD